MMVDWDDWQLTLELYNKYWDLDMIQGFWGFA